MQMLCTSFIAAANTDFLSPSWLATHDYATAGWYAFLGAIGAVFAVYTFLGDFLPGMGGHTQIGNWTVELESRQKKLGDIRTIRDRLLSSGAEPDRLEGLERGGQDYQRDIERLESQISKERWRAFGLGYPLYALLGAFFAAVLGTTYAQAFAIGVAWPAVASQLGLRKELQRARDVRADQINTLAGTAEELKAENDRLSRDNRGLAAQRDMAQNLLKRVGRVTASGTAPSTGSVPRAPGPGPSPGPRE